jgi:hypothetical protein
VSTSTISTRLLAPRPAPATGRPRPSFTRHLRRFLRIWTPAVRLGGSGAALCEAAAAAYRRAGRLAEAGAMEDAAAALRRGPGR